MTADFVQIGPGGKRSEGQLTLERPGKMSFKYPAPARFEIVADGRSVAIIDHKLNTQDEYFIAQTPLKFLLRTTLISPATRKSSASRRTRRRSRSRSRTRQRSAEPPISN